MRPQANDGDVPLLVHWGCSAGGDNRHGWREVSNLLEIKPVDFYQKWTFRSKIELTKIPELTEEEMIMAFLGIEIGKNLQLTIYPSYFPITYKL